MAINDGWTQKGIADTCRTQQSIVSAWYRGEKQGTETQLKPLLDIFGNKLRRQSYRLYYFYNHETQSHDFFKIEGKVIFSHTIFEEKSGYNSKEKRQKLKRFVIHDIGNSNFIFVNQKRAVSRPQSSHYVECPDENGIWLSKHSEILTMNEIISIFDQYAHEQAQNYTDESITLPYLIRKAFIEHGYPVAAIIELPTQL